MIETPKIQNKPKSASGFENFCNFPFMSCQFVSDFDIRISDFVSLTRNFLDVVWFYHQEIRI